MSTIATHHARPKLSLVQRSKSHKANRASTAQHGRSKDSVSLSSEARGSSETRSRVDLASLRDAHKPASSPASDKVRRQGAMAAALLGGEKGEKEEGSNPAVSASLTSKSVSMAAGTVGDRMDDAGRAVTGTGRNLGVLAPAAGLVGDVIAAPKAYQDTLASKAEAKKSGRDDDWAKHHADFSGAYSTTASVGKGAIEGNAAVLKVRVRNSARAAFQHKAPLASRAVLDAAAKEAATQATKEATAFARASAVKAAAKTAAQEAGTLASALGAVNNAGAKKLLRQGGVAAARAATEAATHGAMATAAKAGARFLPGLNVAIAAADAAAFYNTLQDGRASNGKLATSFVTAAGSAIAATNIPGISQAAALVSGVSSAIGCFM